MVTLSYIIRYCKLDLMGKYQLERDLIIHLLNSHLVKNLGFLFDKKMNKRQIISHNKK
jgi:hypothetical protein